MQSRWISWGWVPSATFGAVFLVLTGCWLAIEQAHAVIMKLTPLSEILSDTNFISVGTVEKVIPEKPALILAVTEDLKGKLPARRLPVTLKGDSEAEKLGHGPQLLKRLAADLPMILFTNQRGKRLTVFAYTNGTWFQMVGQQEGDRAVLQFTHCEPYLRRTFKGTTAELKQIVVDGLGKKKAPPEPNPKEPPGLGPEIKKETGASAHSALRTPHPAIITGPPLAVIPTLGIGGPLAILALLFPSLFGGVLLLLRQWLAFFTIFSVNSMLLLIHALVADPSSGSWWSSHTALWLQMTIINLVGVVWAWRRQVRSLEPGQVKVEAPARTEMMVLLLLSCCCLLLAGFYYLWPPPMLDALWLFTFTTSAGIWLATAFRLLRPAGSSLELATEGVILSGSLALALVFMGGKVQPAHISPEITTTGEGRPVAKIVEHWGVPLNIAGPRGLVVSGVRAEGDHLYAAVAHSQGAQNFGTLYCLNRTTKEVQWSFDDEGELKQVFSTPCISDGRLYIGEGFHHDASCKLYCIDIVNIDREKKMARKLWHFPTASQTESTPTVARGKVFIGAGNEGIYAINVNTTKEDAEKGKYAWRYPLSPGKGPLWRVGAGPTVAGKRLYVGSGVDRERLDEPTDTSVVCLDADTGKELWKVKTPLPCWAQAVVAGQQVFVALGNGDVFENDKKAPAGMILCLDATTGRELWRFATPNGIHEKPAVDGQRLYFGCRDGKCYCLGRFDGQQRWSKDLGSPVIASPVLDQGAGNGVSLNVFVISTGGQALCLDSYTGKVVWSWTEVANSLPHLSSPPFLVANPEASGIRRRLYFGVTLNSLSFPAVYCIEDLLPER